ncbi:hypothetical protein ACR79B_20710 [Sphingobacterium spiritivorum]|uniref:hypothetical protein n=1 Tax=Sphingobacterium spiritivorum TaxID=258 RepID=UPI003DA5F6AC
MATTIKFWEEMTPAPNLVENDKLMLGKADNGATYYTDFTQIRSFFGLNANAVLEADTTTIWADQDSGLFIPTETGNYNGVDVDLTEGFTLLKWDGTTLTKILYATKLGTPIKFRIGDSSVVISGGNTTVTDERLQGMIDYPVLSSQLNNSVFRDDELTYNSTVGSFTITNFILMPGEVLVAYPDATGGIGGNNNILLPFEERLSKLEKMVAPLLTGGRMWWSLDLGAIPEGWVEDESWRDFTPIHSPTPTDAGLPVGSNSRILTTNQLGSFKVGGQNDRTAGSSRNNGWWNFKFIGGGQTAQLSNGSGSNVEIPPVTVKLDSGSEAVDMRQKSKYGFWIKYVG